MTTRKHGKGWMADVQLELPDGRSVRKRKHGFKTEKEALDFERQLRGELLGGTYERRRELEHTPTVAAFVREYLDSMATQNRTGTVLSKRSSLARVVPVIGTVLVRDVGARHIEAVRAHCLGSGLKASTVNLTLQKLAHCLATAHAWGLRGETPKARPQRVEAQDPRFLTDDEAAKLVAAFDPRWRPMAVLALNTGLRVGELLGLEWSDVDFGAATVTVRRTLTKTGTNGPKSGKARVVPLNSSALGSLHSLPVPLRPAGVRVFPRAERSHATYEAARHAIDRAARHAGLERVGWHALRHTFATNLCLRGAPIRVVQELLGHASLAMTVRYAHTTTEALAQATALLTAEGRI